MRSRAFHMLSVLLSGAVIASSSGIAAAQSLTFAYPDNSSTAPLLDVAARKARSLSAKTTRAGDDFLVVTYRGNLKNFIQCTRGGAKVSRDLSLDVRSTLESRGSRLKATTLYIVTEDTADAPISLAFSGVEGGTANGLSCRATGALERKLLGMK